MNKCRKGWLLAAIILIIVGAIVFVGALAFINFDFTELSTRELEMNTYELNKDFNNILIDADTANIAFVPSDNGVCKVECVEDVKQEYCVKAENGTLTISVVDNRKWYDYICINFGLPKITIYLPKTSYSSLSITTTTGDIEIPDKFSFETITVVGTTANVVCHAQIPKSVEVSITTGNITLASSQTETVKLSTTTGKITVNDVACDELTAKNSTGRIQLKNVIAEESIKLESTTGGVKFEDCDAGSITVNTSTGDVKGTLLSEKIFITDTSTGRVSVPKTASGGKCEITTSTGDIDIEIE